MIRTVVADDQAVVRAGVALLLDAHPEITVVGQAKDGAEAVALSHQLEPDVIVMDVRMPGTDGIEATRAIVEERRNPDRLTKVLVLTTFDDDQVVYGALRAGASGFLLKHAAPQDLSTAVIHVAQGHCWLDQAVASAVISAMAPQTLVGGATGVLSRLTRREREVLVLMAEGLENSAIADRFVLSLATVRTHVSRILMKTGARDRTQAVVFAYQSGLVVVERPPDL